MLVTVWVLLILRKFSLRAKGTRSRGGEGASFIVLVQMDWNFPWMWQKKLGWSRTNVGKIFGFENPQNFY